MLLYLTPQSSSALNEPGFSEYVADIIFTFIHQRADSNKKQT